MGGFSSFSSDKRQFLPSASWAAQANISSLSSYQQMCQEAEQDYEGFWAKQAKAQLHWKKAFSHTLNATNPPFYKWFEDGKLNASYNCLDVHIQNGLGNTIAIVFETDDGMIAHVTYQDLYEKVCQFANALKAQGIQKGDRVIIYMPMSVEGVVAMQACARVGAIHSVVFGGFSAKSLYERMMDVGACWVLTANEQLRGGKALPLKAIVNEALDMRELGEPQVKQVIVYQRTQHLSPMRVGRDVYWHDVLKGMPTDCEPEWVESEHPLFILYTSGSTGKPKGVQHSTAGYLLWAKLTMQWTFDVNPQTKPNDLFWCTADIGWVTGHSYVAYGPLANGISQMIFEGVPTYPNAARFWQMIDKHQVTIFYTAPTAIRSLIKASEQDTHVHPQNFRLDSLRLLGSVGEPINPEAWMWYYKNVGREQCPIVDTFWQTETGGHMITPLPGATPLVPGSCTLALPGIQAAIVDETGKELAWGQTGILVIKKPWPSMIRTIWGDDARFKKSYFPEDLGGDLYLAGDGAHRDEQTGYFTITGRIDDVLSISGHRLGTMEIESALVAHPLVAEAAVVGKPDDITGEAICAYVVLKRNRPVDEEAVEIAQDLRNWVSQEIGPIAKPKEIRFGDNLPKTRSGKIMRRLLRVIARGEVITQDISTLENPAILEQFKNTN